MNVYFIILGICCQLFVALQYIVQIFDKSVTLALRVRFGVAACLHGLMASLLVYGLLFYNLALFK